MIYLNDTLVVPTIFPDKTSQVWKLPAGLIQRSNTVRWEFEHEGEFMHLAQLRELTGYGTTLDLPYLPYARQDKQVSNDATFALIPFLTLLNALDFAKVIVFDPHNPSVLRTYLSRVTVIEPVREIDRAANESDAEVIVFPDEGASLRYGSLIVRPQRFATKVRDQSTGAITGLSLQGEVRGLRTLIVDDLCDGGMTFIKLSEKLYAAGAAEVHLYVSHGLFTKGVQVLRDSGIHRIFTRQGEVK